MGQVIVPLRSERLAANALHGSLSGDLRPHYGFVCGQQSAIPTRSVRVGRQPRGLPFAHAIAMPSRVRIRHWARKAIELRHDERVAGAHGSQRLVKAGARACSR